MRIPLDEPAKKKITNAFVALALLVATVNWGFAVELNWNWFIAPIINYSLSFWQALGLLLTVSSLMGPHVQFKRGLIDDNASLAYLVAYPAFPLLAGLVLHFIGG